MKTMLIKMNIIISIMSLMMKSPMSMSMTLLTQTIIMIMLMNSIFNSSLIPLITFLAMIGGLLVIFMYMSSITSNEKFKMNMKMIIMMIIMFVITEELMINFQNPEYQNMMLMCKDKYTLTKMYNKSMMMTMLMMTYLIITMITINKIIKLFEGPLRSKTYE